MSAWTEERQREAEGRTDPEGALWAEYACADQADMPDLLAAYRELVEAVEMYMRNDRVRSCGRAVDLVHAFRRGADEAN